MGSKLSPLLLHSARTVLWTGRRYHDLPASYEGVALKETS